jgi:hypothetical protein
MIDALNADDWHARESAEAGLIALGPGIRPAMIALSTSGTPEQRTRAEAILAKLEIAAANSPTLITVHLKDVNPREVIAAIAKQAGIEIPFWPENLWTKKSGMPLSTISIDLDQQPFWIALAQVCQLAGARAETMNMGQGAKLTIQRGNAGEDWLSAPRCVSGQFIVMPQLFIRSRTVSFLPTVTSTASDQMQLRVLVDPKADVVSVPSGAVLTQAMDDKGNSILSKDIARYGITDSPGLSFNISTAVAYQNDGAAKLKSLEGHLDIAVAKRVEHLDIANVAAVVGQVQQIGKWTLTVQACQIDSHSGNLNLSVTVPDQTLPPNDVWTLMRRIQLVDAAGKTLNGGGGFGGSGDGIHYQGNQAFNTGDAIQQPVHLKWSVPVEVEEKKISFHFTDLPLPMP